MLGIYRLRRKYLVIVLETVVDKAPVDCFGQDALYDVKVQKWAVETKM